MKPPHLAALLGDPIYRKYIKTIPRLAPSLAWGTPWAVWARTIEGKWKGGQFPTYADAWAVVVKAIRSPSIEDVALVSRRQLFPPPTPAYMRDVEFRGYDWCSRCRRPSSFAIRPRHHALRTSPVLTLDDPLRCYYCGMRRCAMPTYH